MASAKDEPAATKIYLWRSMRTPVGSGAGHDVPVTPLLVSEIAVELALPVMVAVPVQAVPSLTVPLNDSWPLIEEPLNVAATFPDHATASPVHVALIVDPLCVTLTVICSDALFVEANVPRHVPEISIAVPKLDDVGSLGEPEHASVTISAKRISVWRIGVADHKGRASGRRVDIARHSAVNFACEHTVDTANSVGYFTDSFRATLVA